VCCSLILQGRVDILESVKKNISSPDKLVSTAKKNLQQTGINYSSDAEYKQALKSEVEGLSEKKQFELKLVYKDALNQVTQERWVAELEGTSLDSINTYAAEAQRFYETAFKLLRSVADSAI